MSEVERQFEAASRGQRGFRRRNVIVVLAFALVVVLILAMFAGWQWSVARQEKREAIKRELLASADSLLESDPRLATQVALAANDISAGDDTRASLYNTLVGTGYLGSLHHEGAQRAVAFSPDGRTVAFGGEKGDVVLADPPQPGKPGRNRVVLTELTSGIPCSWRISPPTRA
jgi:hypothetical protein